MFDLPSQAGPARDAAILKHIQEGDFEFTWSPIQSQANGHSATFSVFADGLKIAGTRISGSATLCQQIADLLGCMLLTPRLNDLCFVNANVVIPPQIISPPGTDTATMVRESQAIDAAIAGQSGLVAPIGKPWSLANNLLTHPRRACLYGWQSKNPIQGVPLYPGTLAGVQVIQPISNAHDANYVDYAMAVSLVSRQCTVDGQAMDLANVLTDPNLASLASHEGVLKVLRQPGVPPLTPPPGGLEPASYVQPGGQSSGPVAASSKSMLVPALAFGTAGLAAGLAYFSD